MVAAVIPSVGGEDDLYPSAVEQGADLLCALPEASSVGHTHVDIPRSYDLG